MISILIEKIISSRTPRVSREAIQNAVRAKKEKAGKAVAERYTRGNVAIQSGKFITEKALGRPGAKRPKK